MIFCLMLIGTVVLFQLGLGLINSVAVSMAGQSLGKKFSTNKLANLLISYSLGVGLMTSFLLSTIGLIIVRLEDKIGGFYNNSAFWQIMISCLVIEVCLIIAMVFWSKQTIPYVSQKTKRFLLKRSNKTKSEVEATSLGLITVLINSWLLLVPFVILIIAFSKQTLLRLIFLTSFATFLIPMTIWLIFRFGIKIDKTHQSLIQNKRFFHFLTILSLILMILLIRLFVSSYVKMVFNI